MASSASIVTVAAAIGLQALARAFNPEPETFVPEVEKVRLLAKAGAQWNTVNTLLIDYEGTPYAPTSNPLSVHMIMAVSARGEFYHMVAHSTSVFPWHADPHLLV